MKEIIFYVISAIISVLVVCAIIRFRNEPIVMALLAAGAATAAETWIRKK